MAVITRFLVHASGQEDHDRLQEAVEGRFGSLGGPPDGLMAHLGYPSDGGFLIVEAWRDEASFREIFDGIVRPALTEVGLIADQPVVAPAWSIARP